MLTIELMPIAPGYGPVRVAHVAISAGIRDTSRIEVTAEHIADASTEEEFHEIPREDRFFFTWQEARATEHYKAALAWPLHGGPENARRVVGVLSVDAQTDGAVDELDRVWTDERQDIDAHRGVCEAILETG